MGRVGDRQGRGRVLRRVNRRIETGIVAMPATARCLETTWDHPSGHDDDEARVAANATLVFLHGFSDEAEHWREFAELLVSGTPGGCDIVLPGAPVRPFVVGGVHRHVGAWFEPRLTTGATSSGARWLSLRRPRTETEAASPGPRCGVAGGSIAVRWVDGLLRTSKGEARARERHPRGLQPGRRARARRRRQQGGVAPRAGGRAVPARVPPAPRGRHGGGVRGIGTEEGFFPDAERKKESERRRRRVLCQGGRDEVAPTSWARVAADEMRLARARLGAKSPMSSEDSRVELTVCEDRGHELGADDVWRARWWIRSRLERARERLARSVRRVVNVGSDISLSARISSRLFRSPSRHTTPSCLYRRDGRAVRRGAAADTSCV